MLSVQGKGNRPWHQRTDKAFFRGRDSSRERLKLVEIAKEEAEEKTAVKMDAGITRFFFFKDREKDLGTTKHVAFFDFFKVMTEDITWLQHDAPDVTQYTVLFKTLESH